MELRDLNADERLALLALIKAAVMADRNVSADEQEAVHEIAAELGGDAYQTGLAEVERRFPDEDSLKAFLATITRPEARDVIFGTVFGVAITDTVEGHEPELLDWLAKAWQMEISYEAPEGGDAPGGDGDA